MTQVSRKISELPSGIAEPGAYTIGVNANGQSVKVPLDQFEKSNLNGGTTGQVLTKKSNANEDFKWETPKDYESRVAALEQAVPGKASADALAAEVARAKAAEQAKQDKLTSGTNIKTINGQDILGSGNVVIQAGDTQIQADWNQTDQTKKDYIKNKPSIPADQSAAVNQLQSDVEDIQDTLEDVVTVEDVDPEGQSIPTEPFVEYVAQTLTDEQKTQARNNIGAANSSSLGNLTELATTDKTSAVAAINEVQQGKQASTPSGDPMHYAYVEAGAVWNASTGYWELNTLTNITTAQMRTIYVAGIGVTSLDMPFAYAGAKVRTNLFTPIPSRSEAIANIFSNGYARNFNIMGAFSYCSQLEIVRWSADSAISSCYFGYTDTAYLFRFCTRLRRILGIFGIFRAVASAGCFEGCTALEYVHIHGTKNNIDLHWSPNLEAECVHYMIANSLNTSAITIKLHADALARWQASADYETDLATCNTRNISVISA